MRLPQADSDSVTLMGRVCDEVWREVQATTFFPSPADACDVIWLLATSVLAAIEEGERSPDELRAIALERISQWH